MKRRGIDLVLEKVPFLHEGKEGETRKRREPAPRDEIKCLRPVDNCGRAEGDSSLNTRGKRVQLAFLILREGEDFRGRRARPLEGGREATKPGRYRGSSGFRKKDDRLVKLRSTTLPHRSKKGEGVPDLEKKNSKPERR